MRASAFEAEGWWCKSTRGCQFHARVVQQQRQPSQKRSSAGATPAMGTLSAPVAQGRGRRFKPGVSVSATLTGSTQLQCLCSPTAETAASKPAQRGCESHHRHHFNAPVAQSIERRASNAEAGGESPSGSAISTRSVNRTSVPGLVANEIVLHLRDEEHVLSVPPFSSNDPIV